MGTCDCGSAFHKSRIRYKSVREMLPIIQGQISGKCFKLEDRATANTASVSKNTTINDDKNDDYNDDDNDNINPLAPELFFLILAHSVYKM